VSKKTKSKIKPAARGSSPSLQLVLPQRPRRNRVSAGVRNLVRETHLQTTDLILPLFVTTGKNVATPISSMPGQFRFSRDRILKTARDAFELGIPAVALFPVIPENKKDRLATESTQAQGLLQSTIRDLKSQIPELTVISDVAMDPYSSDGHDGLVENGKILNDPTLEILAQMALSQAQAGADMVAPSDMMDGRVGYIRKCLDQNGFENVGILSYAAKYASSFYGPFREALDSAPKSGDKKTYQMDPANRREAVREAELDIQEGADIIMVKPALAYLDVIAELRARTHVPIAAYQVSGEYAMIQAASKMGWMDAGLAMHETVLSIKRAGADMILTYFALDLARRLRR
jgi:porphobilinogen synthase